MTGGIGEPIALARRRALAGASAANGTFDEGATLLLFQVRSDRT
jgi:hypothetical protein